MRASKRFCRIAPCFFSYFVNFRLGWIMKGCTELNEEKTKWVVYKHPKHTLGRGNWEYHFYTLWIMEILVGGTALPLSDRSQKETQIFLTFAFILNWTFSRDPGPDTEEVFDKVCYSMVYNVSLSKHLNSWHSDSAQLTFYMASV